MAELARSADPVGSTGGDAGSGVVFGDYGGVILEVVSGASRVDDCHAGCG